MRWILAVALLFAGAGDLAAQSKGKGIRLWNLTTETISGFQLSPAGKDAWGPNQTLNDKDKEVDHDERLRIMGVEPGQLSRRKAVRRPQYRNQGRCGVLDRGQGPEGLQQVILAGETSFLCPVVRTWIFATPPDRIPFRMLARPFRDVGLGSHHALSRRNIRRKHQMAFLAGGRRQYGAYGYDQIDRIHASNP